MEKLGIKNGVIVDISNEAYHASSGVSRSALMDFKKSPYHYWWKHLSGMRAHEEPTPAMVMGEMTHVLSLEPENFSLRYAVIGEADRRTKQGREDHEKLVKNNPGKTLVKAMDVAIAQSMSNAVRGNSLAESLIKDAQIEKSIYFTHATTGIQCKVRPDIWQSSIVGDLKTTNDASFRAFQSSAFKYGYFLQAAMIEQALESLGLSLERFIFIAVEKDIPYATGLYLLDECALEFGRTLFDGLMEKMARCIDSGKWDGYGIQNLGVPTYAKYEEIEE